MWPPAPSFVSTCWVPSGLGKVCWERGIWACSPPGPGMAGSVGPLLGEGVWACSLSGPGVAGRGGRCCFLSLVSQVFLSPLCVALVTGTIRKAQNLLKQYSQHGLDGKKGGSNLIPLEGNHPVFLSRSLLLRRVFTPAAGQSVQPQEGLGGP